MTALRQARRASAVLGLTALLLLAAACGSDEDESALAERTEEFFAAVDAKPYDPAAVADFFDEAYVDLDRAATTPEGVSDVDGIQATYAELASAFPDGVHNLELVEAVGDDRVVAYWRFTGTQEGDGTVRRHYSFYGVVVALLGAIPAIPVGVAGSWAATAAYTSFLGVPFASRQLHPWTWAAALGFAVLVGGGSGWLASRQATAIAPAEAMRPGGGAVPGRRTILDRILPAGAPSWLRLAVRNLVRTPGRSVTTALGVVLALLLTMTALVPAPPTSRSALWVGSVSKSMAERSRPLPGVLGPPDRSASAWSQLEAGR